MNSVENGTPEMRTQQKCHGLFGVNIFFPNRELQAQIRSRCAKLQIMLLDAGPGSAALFFRVLSNYRPVPPHTCQT